MKTGKILLSLVALTLIIGITACSKTPMNCGSNIDCSAVTYSGTIQPIVASKCDLSGCHGSSFSTYAGIKSIATNGAMYQTVVADQTMPAGNVDLSCEQRSQIECWLNAGAPNN